MNRERPAANPTVYATYRPPVPGLGRLCLNLLIVFALALPMLFTVGLLAGGLIVLSKVLMPMAVFIALLAVVLAASAVRRLRAEQASRLLNYMRLAASLNLPLPEFLEALQRGEGAGLASRAGKISAYLRLGGGVGEALFRHAPEIPADQTAVVWRGEQSGRLREAFDRVAERATQSTRDTVAARNDVVLQYTLVVLVTLLALASLVSIFILPKYLEIFLDFEAQVPAVTTATFEAVRLLGPVLALVCLALLLWLAGWSAYTMVFSSESVIGPLRRLLEPVWWRVPVLGASWRSRAWADASFAVEQAMRSGRPLPEAVDTARHPVQSGVVDRKLKRFAAELRAGRAMPQAARAAGLPGLVVGMLGTASASTRPADVFAFLCRYYSCAAHPLDVLIRAAVLPVVTLLAAVCVGWFVFAVFYPLIALIEATLQHTGYA